MSIAMERFGSTDHQFKSLASSPSENLVFPYRLQCRACGFEADNGIVPPPRCPRCTGSAWERFALPRSLLAGPARRTYERPARGSRRAQSSGL
ncbi:MAG: hypothetical protein ABSH22_22195 [Tepidisphaeraceae bacterium]|jgi:rubredoxin